MSVILAVLVGILVGTLIAVLLERLYTGAPLGGSVLPCPRCGEPALRFAWLGTPGWLRLRGRCPACRGALSLRLLYLPLLGGITFGVAAARLDGRHLLLTLLFLPSLLALTATDIERKLLPNRIMYPTLAVAVLLSGAWPGREVRDVLLAGGIGFLVMFIFYWVLPGFGFGDVKLAGLVGLLSGLANLLTSLTMAAFAAAAVSILLLVTRRATLGKSVPYGPYLALGAFAGMLAA